MPMLVLIWALPFVLTFVFVELKLFNVVLGMALGGKIYQIHRKSRFACYRSSTFSNCASTTTTRPHMRTGGALVVRYSPSQCPRRCSKCSSTWPL